jgi:hypothetical protein
MPSTTGHTLFQTILLLCCSMSSFCFLMWPQPTSLEETRYKTGRDFVCHHLFGVYRWTPVNEGNGVLLRRRLIKN